eukprot:6848088-Prymnesium_polylepis.1
MRGELASGTRAPVGQTRSSAGPARGLSAACSGVLLPKAATLPHHTSSLRCGSSERYGPWRGEYSTSRPTSNPATSSAVQKGLAGPCSAANRMSRPPCLDTTARQCPWMPSGRLACVIATMVPTGSCPPLWTVMMRAILCVHGMMKVGFRAGRFGQVWAKIRLNPPEPAQ